MTAFALKYTISTVCFEWGSWSFFVCGWNSFRCVMACSFDSSDLGVGLPLVKWY